MSLSNPKTLLDHNAESMLCRLDQVKSFSLHIPMVRAAWIPRRAHRRLERHLFREKSKITQKVHFFLDWLRQGKGRSASHSVAQMRYSVLRLRFNVLLTHFDLFSDVLTQRSQNDFGVWLSGLDRFAADALELPGDLFKAPPVVCYLERGLGAAIRRVQTRLPGGGQNPVALVRIPRERMIGLGIASSLVHEVGHQGAAILDLVQSLKPIFVVAKKQCPMEKPAWQLWGQWISEVVADLWSVSKIGVASTLGLMSVVSLPRAMVFRITPGDPHPAPWIRVKMSAALGQALYPDEQWSRISCLWESLYPLQGLNPERIQLLKLLEKTLPDFVERLLSHRPPSFKGQSLQEVFQDSRRNPERLWKCFLKGREDPEIFYRTAPSLAFAILGQGSARGALAPHQESELLDELLRHWALTRRGEGYQTKIIPPDSFIHTNLNTKASKALVS